MLSDEEIKFIKTFKHNTKKEEKIHIIQMKHVFNFIDSGKMKILDLACGSGEYSHILLKRGYDVTSVDIKKLCNGLNFTKCSADNLPFKEHTFDMVICTEAIEHFDNPFNVLGEIKRVLKTNGILIMTTPNLMSLRFFFKRYIFKGNYDREHLYGEYSSFNMVRILQTREFSIEKYETFEIIPGVNILDKLLSKIPVIRDMGSYTIVYCKNKLENKSKWWFK